MNSTEQPKTGRRVTPLRSLLGGAYVPRRAVSRLSPDHRNTLSESSRIDGCPIAASRGTRDEV